ncbi:MAG: bifunctional folylpolyglutamate synthase/dihydrofolate synthase [Proteobacteria bacterium]|nr:bifunctional folylpolyglutamate synthase/dihydrofolate synthase [Pseudomonadota bacterium]
MLDTQDLDAWIVYIQSLNPEEMEFSLDRPHRVLARLELVDNLPFVITVAGTNGKGSCVELLSKVFLSAGVSVGSYSSPHLIRFNERVCVNGVPATDEKLIGAFLLVEKARQSEALTFFEYTTLAALVVFSNAGLEVLVLEAGLGGRLDVTNLIDADALLLTNIALDHIALLGEHREKIGFEKAGLMRPRQIVVCGDRDIPKMITDRAMDLDAQLRIIGRDFDHRNEENGWMLTDVVGRIRGALLPAPFSGSTEQLDNAACVADLLVTQSRFKISANELSEGISRAAISGRQQVISEKPIIILDVAHNEAAIQALAEFLKGFSVQGTVYALFAMLEDKSIESSLYHILEHVDQWLIAELKSPRGLPATVLEHRLVRAARTLNVQPSILSTGNAIDLWKQTQKLLKEDDLLIVFGSFLLVGDILGHQSATV